MRFGRRAGARGAWRELPLRTAPRRCVSPTRVSVLAHSGSLAGASPHSPAMGDIWMKTLREELLRAADDGRRVGTGRACLARRERRTTVHRSRGPEGSAGLEYQRHGRNSCRGTGEDGALLQVIGPPTKRAGAIGHRLRPRKPSARTARPSMSWEFCPNGEPQGPLAPYERADAPRAPRSASDGSFAPLPLIVQTGTE